MLNLWIIHRIGRNIFTRYRTGLEFHLREHRGVSMKFIEDIQPGTRTFLLTAVAMAAPAGETGFQIGAWGEVFYSRPMGAWAIVTSLLFALLLVPREKLPIPPKYLFVLLVPSVWILLKMFILEYTGGQIFRPLLFGLGVVTYLLCLPFAAYLIIKIINPDLLDLKGTKPKVSLVAIFLTMFLVGYALGQNNHLFVECEDFVLAGDLPPANCRPESTPVSASPLADG